MRAKPIPMEEQYKLVLECRQSGLSDYHWCLERKRLISCTYSQPRISVP